MEPARAAAPVLHADRSFPQRVRRDQVANCPSTDLVAVVTESENVDVYRFDGQRAFGRKRKADCKVSRLCWKYNGQHLAVAWDDGSLEVISAETGKVVPRDSQDAPKDHAQEEAEQTSCLGWGVNFIDPNVVKTRTDAVASSLLEEVGDFDIGAWDSGLDEGRHEIDVEDFLHRQPDLQKLDVRPDLPQALALTDIERLLPKLPSIPAPPSGPFMRPVASIPDVYLHQTSLDDIFHSQHLRDHNAVDVLIRGQDGAVQPTIYDSLSISTITITGKEAQSQYRPVLHTSHPYSPSHLFLAEISNDKRSDSKARLALFPLTIHFLSSAGIHLHVIATRTVQLQNLLRYVEYSLRCVSMFWYHGQDLPTRFIRNISETLQEKHEGDLVQSLYHLAVTGNCSPTVKEWLVDELTEAGHKRWDAGVTQGYAKTIEVVHENLLPALDRASLVVSTLRGLAKFHESSWNLNVPVSNFTAILATIRSLRILAHAILLHAGDERRQFYSFSKWLRYQIDVQATDPHSQSAEELLERDPGVDYSRCLAYIQGAMQQSDLVLLIRKQAESAKELPQDAETIACDQVVSALKQHRSRGAVKKEALCTWNVFLQLQAQCRDLFGRITAWKASSCNISSGLVLEEGKAGQVMDMRINEEGRKNMLTTYIAYVSPEASNEIRIHRLVHTEIIDDFSKSIITYNAFIMRYEGVEILDVKLPDDERMIFLCRGSDTTYLVAAPYRQSKTGLSENKTAIRAVQLPEGKPLTLEQRPVQSATVPDDIRQHIIHEFPDVEGFKPVKIDANGRKDRRVVLVLDEGCKRYRIYDMDAKEADEDGMVL